MTGKELESRIALLEKAVERLRSQLEGNGVQMTQVAELDPAKQRHWWIADAGKFKDDPEFDEVIRLGKGYRDSGFRDSPDIGF